MREAMMLCPSCQTSAPPGARFCAQCGVAMPAEDAVPRCTRRQMSEFVETSIREKVERRRVHEEFIARGLCSRDQARQTGDYVDADVVLAKLQRKLDAARSQVAKKRK